MKYQDLFVKNNITNLEKLFLFIKEEIEYGWIDKKENRHFGVNDAELYILQTPEELIKNKLGICWDITELCRCYFTNMTDLKIETYYIFYDDNKGCPSHSIIAFYKNNKIYWYEPMFQNDLNNYKREYNNLMELLIDAQRKFINFAIKNKMITANYKKENVFIYKYNQPKFHINGYEMRNHINRSELIKISN